MYEPHYAYTKGGTILTEKQRQFYEENGYIVFRKLVDDATLDECKQRFLDICNGKVKRGMTIVMKDEGLKNKPGVKGEDLIYKIQDFIQDDVMFKYLSYKAMVDVVADIIGSGITTIHAMLINKPPNSDQDASRHPLHQDLHYFPFRPAENVVAAWTAMEKINEENGCLFVIPGSHKGSLYKHEYPENVTNKAFHGVFGLDYLPRVNLAMETGDTVFFHPLILHGSGPNMSKGFRKAISCHFAANDCYFIDVTGTTQEHIAKEIEDISAKLKLNLKSHFDFWKHKSRLIRGAPGIFQTPIARL